MSSTTNLKPLGDIADIRTGYTFRERVEEISKNGNAHIAQIKDVRSLWEKTNTSLCWPQQLPKICWQGKDNAFVNPGSVLLPARGSKGGYFRASYLISSDEEDPLPVVVSSQFLVITPKESVLPEFLCWSLNQPAMQYWLAEGAGSQGSSIVMLNTKVAKELKLEIPSLETQQKILHLNQLWEQEHHLTHALLKNRETMLQGMFQQLLKEKNA
jgi:restriction endonuclease S subunit